MGLSGWHVLLLIIIILVFFGPSRLPSLGKSMGEAIRGFKKGLRGDEIDVTPKTLEAREHRAEQLQSPAQENSTYHQQTTEKDKINS